MFEAQYRKKCVSPEQAVSVVRSGDYVDYNFALAQPVALDMALAARKESLRGVTVRGGMRFLPLAVVECDPTTEHFRYTTWHVTAYERKLSDMGLCSYIPMVYRNMPLYYRKSLKVDVAMFSVPPMDEQGYFNFSLTNSASRAIIDKARTVILEVNTNLPVIAGNKDSRVHIDEVDFVVESHNPALPEIKPAPSGPTEEKIARLIMGEIRDGATLQLGIGGLPNAVGTMIVESDLKDLGMHTEMLVDAYMVMHKAGKLTNARKKIHPGKGVFTFCVGSRDLYDWAHNNPGLATYSSEDTNSPDVVAQLDDMITINSCVECDILGQVSSETSGSRQISGTGGQLDFLDGGYRSSGGKSFICCTSTFTDKEGKLHSRIRPKLPEYSVVTDPRSLAHCLVTEWGIADLAGCSIAERVDRIIAIAHPDFRQELARTAEACGFTRRASVK